MKTISEQEFEQVIRQDQPVVIEFTAGWCPDCLYINPYLPELEKANPEFMFYALNRDDALDLCEKLDILGIPSFLVFDAGREVARFVSKLRKTPAEIQNFLDEAKEKINGKL